MIRVGIKVQGKVKGGQDPRAFLPEEDVQSGRI